MNYQELNKELQFKATRSSGNGGQNVNKVSTRIELLFDVDASRILTFEEKKIMLSNLGRFINQNGVLRIVCQETRSQHKNKLIAIQKFQNVVELAFLKPKERKEIKVPKSVIAKRKEQKRMQSEKKQQRKKVDLSKINLFF